jgi:tetratricopeptide (TPR) repeat protein
MTRLALAALQLALALAVLWQAAALAMRPDPRDDLRRADALFAAGRYHEAHAAYRALAARAPDSPSAQARLGLILAVRGELPAASRALAAAVGLRPDQATLDLVRLSQGRVADLAALPGEAAQFYALVGARSPLAPLRDTLVAEAHLRAGDYPAAEASYRAALAGQLPPRWRAAAQARLAALRATTDAAAALAELALAARPAPPGYLTPALTLAEPLLPPPSPGPQELAAALQAEPAQRPQLIGQLLLAAGLHPLAEAQFAAVPPDAPGAIDAAAYAAYTRWASGDRAGGLAALQALAAAHPAEPRVRTLLAGAYLAAQDERAASEQLDAARALAPRDPATHLVLAQLAAARRDYLAAAEEHAAALRAAPPEQRGAYALAAARFHLAAGVQLCDAGLPTAEEAARQLSADPGAWSALAAARLACGDAQGSAGAARESARLSPTSPEAAYHLGRALAALGDRGGARAALVAAADLAPASEWRARAEAQLLALGLSQAP